MTARAGVRASFDGRNELELERGSTISLSSARCPLPVLKNSDNDGDWFDSIVQVRAVLQPCWTVYAWLHI
jgi:NAD kinase